MWVVLLVVGVFVFGVCVGFYLSDILSDARNHDP
jgi:hypothetical protein